MVALLEPPVPTVVRYPETSGIPASTCSIFPAASLVALSRVPAGISWVICSEPLSATEPRKSVLSRLVEAIVPAKTSTAATRITAGRRSAKPSTGR